MLAAGLMVAGDFVKHNLVALPIATTPWLFWLRRCADRAWTLGATAALTTGLLLMQAF